MQPSFSVTVPGEEQGLLGATYFAEQAKKSSMDIEAMFTNDIIGIHLAATAYATRQHGARFLGRHTFE